MGSARVPVPGATAKEAKLDQRVQFQLQQELATLRDKLSRCSPLMVNDTNLSTEGTPRGEGGIRPASWGDRLPPSAAERRAPPLRPLDRALSAIGFAFATGHWGLGCV